MRWSYKTVHFELKKEGLLGSSFLDESEIELSLNEYGKSGWELISMLETMDGLIAVFKQSLSLETESYYPQEEEVSLDELLASEPEPESEPEPFVAASPPVEDKVVYAEEVVLVEEFDVVEEFDRTLVNAKKSTLKDVDADVGLIVIE
ncbi:MAG: hypothetical protein COA36_01225 [Desulfotalea sp.]|nr:MAG: hypothetical protein COA36_01225 [Desulfotalea sp.]